MRGSPLLLSLGLSALALGCISDSTSITLAHLPERFDPVGRLEDSLSFTSGWLCRRPFELTQDCDADFAMQGVRFAGRLYYPGVSLATAASADGRIVAFHVLGVGNAGRGVTTSSISNFGFAAIAAVLREAGIAIVRPRPLTTPGKLYGYLLELDGDGYAALRAASASAPVPAPPASFASAASRPSPNPMSFEVALLVEAPASVIDEARGADAITWLNCENVVVFSRSCSNWTGPQLEVALAGTRATLAANRAGDVLLVGGKNGFAAKLGGHSDALNESTRAVLERLRARGVGVRRVRAAVFDEKGPAYAYLVELDRDGFGLFAAAAPPAD